MKTIVAFMLLFIANYGNCQSDKVITLPCGKWGTPDWSKFKNEDAKQKLRFGRQYQKRDHNIRLIRNGDVFNVYNNPIEIHWLLEDTSICYDIRLTDDFGDVVFYETISNDCGLRLDLQRILKEAERDYLVLVVERNKKHIGAGPAYSIQSALRPLQPVSRKNIDSLLMHRINGPQDLANRSLAAASKFASLKQYADALTVLSSGVNDGLDDNVARTMYWQIVYDMYTISDDHLEYQK